MRKFHEVHISKYMKSMQLVERGPIQLVPMYWPHGLDELGIVPLLYMPQFGRYTEVDTCMKQLLVCFHEGCIWLNT